MRKKRLLLAAAALTTAIGCGGKKKHVVHANPKGSVYDEKGPLDAGTDAPPPASDDAGPAESLELPGNPKGAFYDDGLAKPPGT